VAASISMPARQRASVTAHGPGHDRSMLLVVAEPVQFWVPVAVGPVTFRLPSLATVPLYPVNGAAKLSEHEL
jgi:hypothetical protein